MEDFILAIRDYIASHEEEYKAWLEERKQNDENDEVRTEYLIDS